MQVAKSAMVVWVFCLLVGACTPGAETGQTASRPSFADPAEVVPGWYHRHEYETWIAKGASRDVIDSVLQKIELGQGARAQPDLVDTIEAYGAGNWVYEWVQAGSAAMDRAYDAQTAGDQDAAYASFLAALAYFTTASWPHPGTENDKAALDRAREAYLEVGQQFSKPVQHMSFPVGNTTTKGYLHLPTGSGPFPVIVYTYGSDVTKEDGLGFFRAELERRGIALFSVDLPGIGESSHISLLEGSDSVLGGAVAFMASLPPVDKDLIFIAGVSFGGNAAARAFFNYPAAGVIHMCGPLHTPFVAPRQAYDALPALTVDGVKARLGIHGESNDRLVELAPGLSLANQGIYERSDLIDTPLLILTTHQDPVAPLADLRPLQAAAENAQTVVIEEVGHCPSRWLRQPIVARWVEDQVSRSR